MSDRETVIERLRRVSYYFKSLLAVGWKGDADVYREHMESVNMALNLLKEQEPVEPIKEPLAGSDYAIWQCGSCKAWLRITDRFCGRCGKAVKLDE